MLLKLLSPIPLPLLQECDTIEGGKIYFEDFLRIVTEENRSVVQTLAVRATCIDTCREPHPPSPAPKPAACPFCILGDVHVLTFLCWRAFVC